MNESEIRDAIKLETEVLEHVRGLNDIERFVAESNRIEGILREPSKSELGEFQRFLALKSVSLVELQNFVSVYQPGATLRDEPGMDVVVGSGQNKYFPPPGGIAIRADLQSFLNTIKLRTAYVNHLIYESLHPFTDGNGRSGRALWAWQMKKFPLGFLHHFYYQTLAARNEK